MKGVCIIKLLVLLTFLNSTKSVRTYTKHDLKKLRFDGKTLCFSLLHCINYREEVREMFHHAYDSYLKFAYPYDELRPVSCDGIDTYGRYY